MSEKKQNFIEKLRSLSETKNKIIFFTVIIISAIGMVFWGLKSTGENISKIGDSLQSIDFPEINIPDDKIGIQGFAEVSSNPSPIPENLIADWETYTSDIYGFKIQYPNDWPVPIENNSENKIDFNGKVLITYYKNDSDLPTNSKNNYSLGEWLSKNKYSYLDKKTIENAIVGDNYPAIKIKESYCGGAPFLANVYFTLIGAGSIYPAHGNIYQIEGPVFECGHENIGQDYNDAEKIFNEMIKTFKFTN